MTLVLRATACIRRKAPERGGEVSADLRNMPLFIFRQSFRWARTRGTSF